MLANVIVVSKNRVNKKEHIDDIIGKWMRFGNSAYCQAEPVDITKEAICNFEKSSPLFLKRDQFFEDLGYRIGTDTASDLPRSPGYYYKSLGGTVNLVIAYRNKNEMFSSWQFSPDFKPLASEHDHDERLFSSIMDNINIDHMKKDASSVRKRNVYRLLDLSGFLSTKETKS